MNPKELKLLMLDVDGVLTDGRIVSSAEGEPLKLFHVRDGLAIKLWQKGGGQVAVLTGRGGDVVANRAAELGIKLIRTKVSDKLCGFAELLTECGLSAKNVVYVGDDVPDLPVMEQAGFAATVADAAPAAKRVANYVSRLPGGRGAVAEIVELVLRKQGRWAEVTSGG